MTEEEWLWSCDPIHLFNNLCRIREVRGRKLRLFACACCRRIEHLFSEEWHWKGLELAEAIADGIEPEEAVNEFRRHWDEAPPDPYSEVDGAVGATVDPWEDWEATEAAATAAVRAVRLSHSDSPAYDGLERAAQAQFLRCIFGNPFRPVALSPSWLTGNVRDIAQAVYDERAFDRLPILADALLDAGCDSEAILSHCRSEGPHVRGCWVVDLILGKS